MMEKKFDKQSFGRRLKSMLKADFRRVYTMPLLYIMTGVSLILPILILVMTTMMGTTADPVTGETTAVEAFTNVWQAIGSVSGTAMNMDLTGMCNINMIYFLVAIFVCIFVADDFRSGYAKNLFAVRAKKAEYCISKTAVGFVGGVMMILAYFIGAMIGGAIAGLSFDMGATGAGGIVACMLSKVFFVMVFVSIALLFSVVGKQKLWLSVLGSLAAGMLLFTMIPMVTPLDANFLNVIICLAGGVLFGVGLGAVSNVILKKTDLV